MPIFDNFRLKLIRPIPNSTCGFDIPKNLTYMTWMRLGWNHLCDLGFKKFSGHTNIFFQILDAKLKRQQTIYTIAMYIKIKRLPSW